MHQLTTGFANSRFWMTASISIGLLAGSCGVAAADKVYVANEEADSVSVLDAASFKVSAPVSVGKMPHNVQVSPDGKFVWVTNNGEPDAKGAPANHGMARGSTRRWPRPEPSG